MIVSAFRLSLLFVAVLAYFATGVGLVNRSTTSREALAQQKGPDVLRRAPVVDREKTAKPSIAFPAKYAARLGQQGS